MKLLLLIVPCALALAPWVYNRVEPQLFGVPFFYWAQIALIPAAALATLAAYLMDRR
ncbi:MAG: DUF3311 domain-containing protein [Hyphomicrobiales bacterium]|nr:DUF3311 domain-containing protein [Hyphomicrobiales bacterium]